MEMATKSGSKGASVPVAEDPSVATVEVDRGSTRKRGESRGANLDERSGVYVNERGEVCYGNDCVALAIDTQRGEIRVNIKRGGTCEVDSLVSALREALGGGNMKTVYEIETIPAPAPPSKKRGGGDLT
jgi:hypothetical protein